MGHYFGWMGVGGKIFLLNRGGWNEWGRVHCLTIPIVNNMEKH